LDFLSPFCCAKSWNCDIFSLTDIGFSSSTAISVAMNSVIPVVDLGGDGGFGLVALSDSIDRERR